MNTLLLTIFVLQVFANIETSKIKNSEIRKPTSKCHFFNDTSCIGTGCQKIEQCGPQNEGDVNQCFVVWNMTEDGKPIVSLKGCILNHELCEKNTCVDSTRDNNRNKFCCCVGDLCNGNFSYEPPEQKMEEVPLIGIKFRAQNINVLYYTLAGFFFCVTCFLTIIAVIILTREEEVEEEEDPILNLQSSSSLDKWPIDFINIKAVGRYGAVWKAKIRTKDVAVKTFPIKRKRSWLVEQEIYNLPHISHPNILQYVGAEVHVGKLHNELWLITAYHDRGSLFDYLHAHTITWKEMCRITETMARGLHHLHHALLFEPDKPTIAHRDFKSKNVILRNDMSACIADFGMAMVFEPGKPCGNTLRKVGAVRYLAPEILEGAIDFTPESFLKIDMYACGLVLWEIVSRCAEQGCVVPDYKMPFEEELGARISVEQLRPLVVDQKARPKIPAHWRTKSRLASMCETIENCWDQDAEARLSAECVMERTMVLKNFREPPSTLHIENEIQ